jgi:RHS repeat-associated protein
MLVHNLNVETADKHTWTTRFDHDAFGRIKTVTYPDGEVVTYDYDSGGLLNSAIGNKLGTEYPYVTRLEYDEFQVRRYRETGTEVGTTYTYNAASRRLDNILTNTPAREVQDWNYSYDLVGNVKTANNNLPAPKPSLLGGPSTQEFQYDVYYRLTSATGRFNFAPKKHRDYTYALAYDGIGNLTSKSQTDTIFNNPNNGIVQAPTTYNLAFKYDAEAPHQVTRIGSLAYSHDANGNFTGWDDDNTGQNRSVTWNADGRVASVANQGSTTRYTYDDTGRLALERGPSGETAFVNRWYTVRNGAVEWKNIWAGDQRIATKRQFDAGDVVDDVLEDPAFEHMVYYFHEDLFGSTNIVTDRDALVFQHLEYFPGGEIWVQEHSVVQRTPYLYAGGYYDEVRKLVNLGQRWYEPREQFFYSTDPVLNEDPERVLADPGLLAAYTYAENNPMRLVDRDGRAPEDVQNLFRAAFGRPDGSLDPAKIARLNGVIKSQTEQLVPNKAIRMLAKAAADPSGSFRKSTAFLTDKLGSKPLVEVNLDRTADGLKLRNIKFSPFFGFKQFTRGKK